jgi:hypothetical protein
MRSGRGMELTKEWDEMGIIHNVNIIYNSNPLQFI